MKEEITKLEDYNPTSEKKIKSKEEVLHNVKKLFDIRSRVIKAFKDGIFSLHKENLHKEICIKKICIRCRLKKKKRRNYP